MWWRGPQGPTPEQQAGLKRFLGNGNHWFALHATNALIEFVGETVEVDGIKIPGQDLEVSLDMDN